MINEEEPEVPNYFWDMMNEVMGMNPQD